MSAFICNTFHLSILGRAASALPSPRIRTGYDIGAAEDALATLYYQNVRSICYRYIELEDSYPERVAFDNRALHGAIDPLQVIKACHCYEYQASETPDYEDSDAAAIIRRIIAAFSRELTGYQDAQWEMTPRA